MAFELSGKRVWVAGHNGMVGSALVRRLAQERGALLTVDRATLDLMRQEAVERWLNTHRPDAIIIAAAKVGGIQSNRMYPAEFIHNNLTIANNIIEGAHRAGVEKLLFLGSSCIYPRLAEQPITEDSLLSGPLEPTNQWYAIAKIAGVKLCEAYREQYGCDYISAMPTNLYGPCDNFDLTSSHVLPALIAKMHLAKINGEPTVTIWGTGRPMREFMFVDDLADALVFVLKHYSDPGHINIGVGNDVAIAHAAEAVAKVVGFEGKFVFDTSKPDGTPRKLMDSSRLFELGWRPRTDLIAGLTATYNWYLENVSGSEHRHVASL